MTSNPLTNVLTPRIRGYLYAALTVLAAVFAAYQASDGDWVEFVGGVITALLGLTAASNASWTPTGDSGDLPDETHDGNHAPLADGVRLDPGFCKQCDDERLPPT